MAKAMPKEKHEEIKKLSKRGVPQTEIARKVGVPQGTVSKQLRKAAKEAAPTPEPEDLASQYLPPLDLTGETIDREALRVRLSAMVRGLDEAAARAHHAGDMSAYAALSAKSLQASSLLAKILPKEVVVQDPNEHPDMIAAAAHGRAKLLELLDRIERNGLEPADPKAPARRDDGSIESSPLLTGLLDELTIVERAALAYCWRGWLARPDQLIPTDRNWQMLYRCTGRGWGKTRANAEAIRELVETGESRVINIIAQGEDEGWQGPVEDPEAGLLAISPPWFKPWVENGEVNWPNGAFARVLTPNEPGAIYGKNADTVWVSELHEWPTATMLKAYSTLEMGLRERRALMVVDTNPKKRHPIMKRLRAACERDPIKNRASKGSTFANVENLNKDRVDGWVEEYGGTQLGRLMLDGEDGDEDDENALWKQAWIDRARRELPAVLTRKIIAIDPHTSQRKGTDATGIILAGLATDGQCFVLGDKSAKHQWDKWGDLVVADYVALRCDCIVVERNRGGDACKSNIRLAAREYGRKIREEWEVVVVENDAPTRYVEGTIYVKEVIGRDDKATRADPVAAAYERGRVSHPYGVDLSELEALLTTWVPGDGVSPNALDALTWAVWELLGLGREKRRANQSKGIQEAQRRVTSAVLAFAASDKL